jgi:hypothetical protein
MFAAPHLAAKSNQAWLTVTLLVINITAATPLPRSSKHLSAFHSPTHLAFDSGSVIPAGNSDGCFHPDGPLRRNSTCCSKRYVSRPAES